ncbi:MAG: hypothetical protein ABFD46_06365 [Armatimonadota bacterium]
MPFHIRFMLKPPLTGSVVRVDLTKEQLDEFFLIPFHNDGHIIVDGTPIHPDDTKSIRISETQESFAKILPLIQARQFQNEKDLQSAGLVLINTLTDEWYAADYGTDRTGEFLTTPSQGFLSPVNSLECPSLLNGDLRHPLHLIN